MSSYVTFLITIGMQEKSFILFSQSKREMSWCGKIQKPNENFANFFSFLIFFFHLIWYPLLVNIQDTINWRLFQEKLRITGFVLFLLEWRRDLLIYFFFYITNISMHVSHLAAKEKAYRKWHSYHCLPRARSASFYSKKHSFPLSTCICHCQSA